MSNNPDRALGANQRVVMETARFNRGRWIKAEDCWDTGGRPLRPALRRDTTKAMRSLAAQGRLELTIIDRRVHVRIGGRP